ncbi:MAG: hypothetical protein COU11_01760 [Candidatus Harrisonbacteria bacterium CG10_big_fil_rev_8_21_14_0_10_49_15]|uniref:LamG-like jellyroll fold domain-containing protein n=1 Tax=Candidatus Harrisonbacteria bacterium CG10_big_fil_rev_8_21_14_0_10_49_15 TaxID=1974587 RepID=A0A2H0UL95_9BACT|nr:MAG: hypothetical protein COU11_01760 [Candidatus Harrisonbacteria bacterium CG10_big_fil_rev_8_21_14_0_10_49_15]
MEKKFRWSRLRTNKGFTLIELLVAITIFVILSSIIIIRIRPQRQIETARNAQRTAHIVSLADAVSFYVLETMGDYPPGIDASLRMIGTATSGCDAICPLLDPESPPVGQTNTFVDLAAELAGGTHSNTVWGSGYLGLTIAGMQAGTGTFESTIKDAGQVLSWTQLEPSLGAPYGKALPSLNTSIESGYPSGNISMSGAVVHYHLDQTSGAIADSSGTNNNGSTPGGLTHNQTGIFSKAVQFNGGGNYINVPYNASLRLPNTGGALSTWFYIDPSLNLSQDTGMGIMRVLNDSNWAAPSGFGLEAYRNTPGGPIKLKASIAQAWNSVQTITGSTSLQLGTWYHVVFTWNSSTVYIYLNGSQDASAGKSKTVNWGQNQPTIIGHNFAAISNGRAWFKGKMDELTIWGRTVSSGEARDMFKRGAMKVKFQVRTCELSNCSGETFIGPDGTSGTYYSEETNTGSTPLVHSLAGLTDARYLQYQAVLETTDSGQTPLVYSVSVTNLESVYAASSCLDLSSSLTPNYLNEVPFDPDTGSAEKTQYAVKKIPGGIELRACTPGLGQEIEIIQ